MTQFDQGYYDGIWPDVGVHRHDYCESLADQLIRTYGKVRILDIGTGCGFLVKCLWKRGATAVGLEISEYAVANGHGDFVRQGDIRKMPFADKSFDVVHSNGLWEYVPEEDVAKAWAECKRVCAPGGIQYHNYDTEESYHPPEHQFVTTKPREWWEAQFA